MFRLPVGLGLAGFLPVLHALLVVLRLVVLRPFVLRPLVLRPLVLAALLLTGFATLLTIELNGAPTLLGVLVVVLLHAIRHCWLLSTTMSPRDLRTHGI